MLRQERARRHCNAPAPFVQESAVGQHTPQAPISLAGAITIAAFQAENGLGGVLVSDEIAVAEYLQDRRPCEESPYDSPFDAA